MYISKSLKTPQEQHDDAAWQWPKEEDGTWTGTVRYKRGGDSTWRCSDSKRCKDDPHPWKPRWTKQQYEEDDVSTRAGSLDCNFGLYYSSYNHYTHVYVDI